MASPLFVSGHAAGAGGRGCSIIRRMVETKGSGRNARRRPRWLVLRLLRIAVVGYLAWCGAMFFKQTDLVFPRHFANIGQAPERPDLHQLWIDGVDGARVEAWLFLAGPIRPERIERRPCVVIFHGNADLIDHMTEYADFYQSRGVHACLMEYRGYGRSTGTPGEASVVADAVALIDMLAARPEIDPKRIILHGRSLGAAVAAQAAARRRPAALVLESPFLSVTHFARRFGVPGFLVRHPFRTDRVLPGIAAAGVPILIMHSRGDEIIPFAHAERLCELVPSARLVELTGGHNDMTLNQAAPEEALDALLLPLEAADGG